MTPLKVTGLCSLRAAVAAVVALGHATMQPKLRLGSPTLVHFLVRVSPQPLPSVLEIHAAAVAEDAPTSATAAVAEHPPTTVAEHPPPTARMMADVLTLSAASLQAKLGMVAVVVPLRVVAVRPMVAALALWRLAA